MSLSYRTPLHDVKSSDNLANIYRVYSFEQARRVLTEFIPKHVEAYFHRTVFHLHRMTTITEKELLRLCFDIRDRDEDQYGNRQPGRKLSITGPSEQALQFLLEIEHVQLYSTELALDPIYQRGQAALVQQAMEKTIAQRWAGNRDANNYFGTHVSNS
jgi:hypothetical protein